MSSRRLTTKQMIERARLQRLETAHESGVGPITLDVQMARGHGWSIAQIDRALQQLGAISRREAGISHRHGPVPGCPCETCDLTTPIAGLMEPSSRRRREAWRRKGICVDPLCSALPCKQCRQVREGSR
jgi:hypothetical protein